MKISKISDMKGGWFIGNFEPSLLQTNACEVAVKIYKKGDYDSSHYHKIATEYTMIVKGKVRMFNRDFGEGTIVVVEPGETTDFIALEDTVNVVVKIPGANDDKYLVDTRGKEYE